MALALVFVAGGLFQGTNQSTIHSEQSTNFTNYYLTETNTQHIEQDNYRTGSRALPLWADVGLLQVMYRDDGRIESETMLTSPGLVHYQFGSLQYAYGGFGAVVGSSAEISARLFGGLAMRHVVTIGAQPRWVAVDFAPPRASESESFVWGAVPTPVLPDNETQNLHWFMIGFENVGIYRVTITTQGSTGQPFQNVYYITVRSGTLVTGGEYSVWAHWGADNWRTDIRIHHESAFTSLEVSLAYGGAINPTSISFLPGYNFGDVVFTQLSYMEKGNRRTEFFDTTFAGYRTIRFERREGTVFDVGDWTMRFNIRYTYYTMSRVRRDAGTGVLSGGVVSREVRQVGVTLGLEVFVPQAQEETSSWWILPLAILVLLMLGGGVMGTNVLLRKNAESRDASKEQEDAERRELEARNIEQMRQEMKQEKKYNDKLEYVLGIYDQLKDEIKIHGYEDLPPGDEKN